MYVLTLTPIDICLGKPCCLSVSKPWDAQKDLELLMLQLPVKLHVSIVVDTVGLLLIILRDSDYGSQGHAFPVSVQRTVHEHAGTNISSHGSYM